MPSFRYKGRSETGKIVEGTLDASSEESASRELLRRQIVPLQIVKREQASVYDNKIAFDFTTFFRRFFDSQKVTAEELVMFCRQMYAMTKAGLPLVRVLKVMAESVNKPVFRRALEVVLVGLESGATLSSSMAQCPDVFAPIVINMIRTGENTGQLDQAFRQIALYIDLERETHKRIKQAGRYPIMVMSFLGVAMVIVNYFVIPSFANIFARFDADLPLPTRILLSVSGFFVDYWWLLALLVGSTVWGCLYFMNTKYGRLFWDEKKLRIPLFGSILERVLLARFSRVFSMLSRAGMPIVQALQLLSETMGNVYIGQALMQMQRRIQGGDGFTRTAMATKLFSPLVIQMIQVGEETGSLDTMLLEVAEYYEEEVDYDLKRLSDTLEPILIVLMGVMVLVLALGIFLPMWELGNVSTR